jgi:hypothetical protein
LFKVVSTKGILDQSGEQVEEFAIGDEIRVADHALDRYSYPDIDFSRSFKVHMIEVSREDHNDILLSAIIGQEVWEFHRMDVEHVR